MKRYFNDLSSRYRKVCINVGKCYERFLTIMTAGVNRVLIYLLYLQLLSILTSFVSLVLLSLTDDDETKEQSDILE